MIFINIRIFINEILFTISKFEKETEIIMAENKLVIPKSFNIGDKLKYIRKYITTLVNLYCIKQASLNTDEYSEIEIIELLKIEGIIEESLSNCGVNICK